jgi:hypothetical protein
VKAKPGAQPGPIGRFPIADEPTKENEMGPEEYPDPAQRYEDLHRDEREFEREYDDYLNDEEE